MEVVVILVLVFMFFCWLIYLGISKWWLNRSYKPENDKSRLGEEARKRRLGEEARKRRLREEQEQRTGATNTTTNTTVDVASEQGGLGIGEILPPSPIEPIGETSNSDGKNSDVARGFFSKFKRR